jgi:hypothetical protein
MKERLFSMGAGMFRFSEWIRVSNKITVNKHSYFAIPLRSKKWTIAVFLIAHIPAGHHDINPLF